MGTRPMWQLRVENQADPMLHPTWNDTVPFCSMERCPHFDGKRCDLIGRRPDNLCEPAVGVMGRLLRGDEP